MKISVVSKIDTKDIENQLQDDNLWLFASNEWYRLISPYTPRDIGNLMQNVTIQPKKITYNANYSVYVYNGKNMHFRKEKNPKANFEWDKKAMQEKQDQKLNNAVQSWVDKNI